MAFTPHEEETLKSFVKELADVRSNPTFVDEGGLIRDIRRNIITADELASALAPIHEAVAALRARVDGLAVKAGADKALRSYLRGAPE